MYVPPCEFNTGCLNCQFWWGIFLLIFNSQALNNLASSDSGPNRIYDNLYDYFRLLNLCTLLLPRNKGYIIGEPARSQRH